MNILYCIDVAYSSADSHDHSTHWTGGRHDSYRNISTGFCWVLTHTHTHTWNRAGGRELSSVGHRKSCPLPRLLTHRKRKPEAPGEEVRNILIPRCQAKVHYFWGRNGKKQTHVSGKREQGFRIWDLCKAVVGWSRVNSVLLKTPQVQSTLFAIKGQDKDKMLRKPHLQHLVSQGLTDTRAGPRKPRTSLPHLELRTE